MRAEGHSEEEIGRTDPKELRCWGTAAALAKARDAAFQAAAREGLLREGMTRGQGEEAVASEGALRAAARQGLLREGMTRGQGQVQCARQAHLKKAMTEGS